LIAVIAFAVFASRTAPDHPTASSSPTVGGADAAGLVAIPAPKLTPAHAQACLAFIAQLPSTIRNLSERHVSDGPEQNAAFGNPPITVQCGAAQPKPAPTDTIWPISGVCWFAQTGQTSTVWTTLDREVPVAVTVPNTYTPNGDGSAQWAAEFSAPLVSAMPSIKTPYNC
jgi:hypothetical protein